MRLHLMLLSMAVLVASAASALAIDEVYAVPDQKKTLAKKVTVGRDEITFIDGQNNEIKMPVAEVMWVKFGGEPTELSEAKEEARRNGNYDEALAALSKLKKAEVAPAEAQADLAFYLGLCKAKLALVGKEPIQSAGAALLAFTKAHPTHYTYYEANELLGDLLRADKKYANAVKFYGELAKNKHMAARANALIGWTNLEQNQPDEAVKAFDLALADKTPGATAETQRRLASLGKAACIAAKGKAPEAIKMIEEVIEKSPPEQHSARLYNVLGAAQAKNNDPKAAVMAYLHVDLMYSQDAAEHAEALAHLRDLWKQIGHPDRGDDADRKLQKLYPASSWAKR